MLQRAVQFAKWLVNWRAKQFWIAMIGGYLFSTGPAVWLSLNGFVPASTVAKLYWPIDYAMKRVDLIKNALGWWITLWVGPLG